MIPRSAWFVIALIAAVFLGMISLAWLDRDWMTVVCLVVIGIVAVCSVFVFVGGI